MNTPTIELTPTQSTHDQVKPLLIGGEWITTEESLVSHSPATGEVLGHVCAGGATEIELAVQAAQRAFPAWRALAEEERQAVLQRLHDVLAERRREITTLISREMGKPPFEALGTDMLVTLDALAYYAKRGRRDLQPERAKLTQRLLLGQKAQIVYEPVGVVGIIGPWNLPLGIPMTEIATVLAAGNTVVFKPSEWTPLVGHAIAELCAAAQVPPGVVNVVMGDGTAGAALVAHEGTRRIIFTGSVATGQKVAVECAKRLCPCILELGGVAPAIVRADADPELAARGVVWGRFANNGQFCVAAERVYVNKQIAAPFKAAVARETARLRVGGTNGDSYDVGPLINGQARERVERHVADAVAQGATVLAGGVNQPQHSDTYFAPTVLAGVTPDMAVMREETFGPVLPIMEVADDREAVAHANSLPLGLGMSVWTRDVDAGEQMARELESGMVWINDSHVYYADPTLPWGGVKQSGIGRTHGRWGLQAVSDIKVIAKSRQMPRLWWFPYHARTHKLMEIFVALQHVHGWRAKVRALAEALFAP